MKDVLVSKLFRMAVWVCPILFLIMPAAHALKDGWVNVKGTVTYKGAPVCAMVLINGQYRFSCKAGDDVGNYEMEVPLDENGNITIQAFVSGLAPYRLTTDTSDLEIDIVVQPVDPESKSPAVTTAIQSDASLPVGWQRITGTVALDGTPLCAMVLANGQSMFSCGANDGVYDLIVPLDGDGDITLYVFVSGMRPYKNIFTPNAESAVVLAANDLGMHCMDREFSVFSILPPFNVINAQVVLRDNNGRPYIADDTEVGLFYDAVVDSTGSINSFSAGKTDFWQHANSLFGVDLTEGEGLTGLYMPSDDPQARGSQPVKYSTSHAWFSAEGIPITPFDDTQATNTYPLMRISAVDAQTGQRQGFLDVVVPVATETDCQNCHRTGAMAAEGAGWSIDPDLEIQSKLNILKLHDAEHGTTLEASQPVLCAGCHYSKALDLTGIGPAGEQIGKPVFSSVMHEYHGELREDGLPVFPSDASVEETCYQCHPGSITQCQRGAMKTGGMDCNDCHGELLAVGGTFPLQSNGSIDGTNDGNSRRSWLDLPRCQSCHTGDAVDHLTGPNVVPDANWPFRLRQAYATGDASASPLLSTNNRFAEDTNTLYRFSKGHGEIACEACHGSTHAIWPNNTNQANDNVAAKQLQGFIGPIMECTVCHELGSLPRTTNGPHGLHNINDPCWYDEGHEEAYEANKDSCKACHGLDLAGTALSKMPISRNLTVEDDVIIYAKGELVRCDKCHEMPEI